MADMFDKEELSIIGGLFPNTLAIANAEKQALQDASYKRFSNAAGPQNPFGGLAGLQGMFGTAAGQEIQGTLGYQSPVTQVASLREQAAQQFDTNTSEGLMQMAQFLNKAGDAAGARQAVMVAQGQQQAGATLAKTQAELQKTTAQAGVEQQKLANETAFREELSKIPNPQPEDIIRLATRYGGIDKVMGVLQSSMDKQAMLEFRRAVLAQKEGNNYTPAQKVADMKFGADYNNFVAGGGISTIKTQLDNLDKAITILEKNPNSTGKAVGLADKTGTLSYVSPTAAEAKDLVGGVVQSNLRAVLGGQFAQKEGEQLLARAYNPAQPTKDNLDRLKTLRTQIKTAADSKIQAVQYFETTGSLKGFQGSAYSGTAADIANDTNKDPLGLRK
jgi:hypothetical protein